MLGWSSWAVICASSTKLAMAASSDSSSGRRTLSAVSRSRFVSRTRWMSACPPASI
jgi:hypothetical protein